MNGKSQQPVERAHTVAKMIAEVIAVASGLTFVLSALLNSIVFASWEIPYLQIVTVPDVFIGALNFAIYAAPIPISCFAGIFAFQKFKLTKYIMLAVSIGLIIFTTIISNILINNRHFIFMNIYLFYYLLMPIYCFLIVYFSLNADNLYINDDFFNSKNNSHPSYINIFLAGSAFIKNATRLVFVIYALLLSLFPFIILSENGYFATESYSRTQFGRCKILWRGSENAVVHCHNNRNAIVPSEGLVIEIGASPLIAQAPISPGR